MKVSYEENLDDLSVYNITSFMLSQPGHNLKSKHDLEEEIIYTEDEMVKSSHTSLAPPSLDILQVQRLKTELKYEVQLIRDVLDRVPPAINFQR